MRNFSLNTHHAYLNSNVVISNNTASPIIVKDNLSLDEWQVEKTTSIRLSAGQHVLSCGESNEIIIIEDAVKFGGSKIEKAFVFDNNPWVFISMKDRFYAINMETGEEKVEHLIKLDSIEALGFNGDKPCECFLFRTQMDYSIYNVETGKILTTFSNHIYSNWHLVIYRFKDRIIVYDFREYKTIVEFSGQYSFGSKFYFVNNRVLYGLNLESSNINTISIVGDVAEDALLYSNYLIKLSSELPYSKKYKLFSLGNGEDNIKSTDFEFPYYVDSWCAHSFGKLNELKKEFDTFAKSKKGNQDFPNIRYNVTVINIADVKFEWVSQIHSVKIAGEVYSYPSNIIMPFTLSGVEEGSINFRLRVVETYNSDSNMDKPIESSKEEFQIPKEEKLLGKSSSGNLVITLFGNTIVYRDIKGGKKHTIMESLFDTSYYVNAYFTSDGKSVIFENLNKEFRIFGFEDLSFDTFDIDGISVPRRAGINGYKPEFEFVEFRKPVWRDPISLEKVKPEELSDHIFKSPDGRYTAQNNFTEVFYNRITDKEISFQDYSSLCKEYNFIWNDTEEDKELKVEKRKKLLEIVGKEVLFKYVIDNYTRLVEQSPNIPEYTKNERIKLAVEKTIDEYLTVNKEFTPLFIDKLGYVIYQKCNLKEERRILIGRSVYFLNYVSFSYDSRYLAFAAKMRQDAFRSSEDGVFVLFDLIEKREITRQEQGQNLNAVWMAMFSKTGNVAYYDSKADAYLCFKDQDYKKIKKISGKSLLCFSPSGNYIAFSDQNYIDYTHHPHENWGHQPSGNIFIHPVYDVDTCYEQFNDFGEGISGVACRAGNVASAAFSSDEKRLMAVGDDGVVVVRNLHLQDIEDSLYQEPMVCGNPERTDYRKEERNGLVYISFFGDDGITTDLVEYWCDVDETLDSEQGLIYSADGTILKKSLNIYNEDYTIKQGVKRIENGVFHGIFGPGEGDFNCIKRLYLPDSVEFIGEDVFDEHGNGVAIIVSPDKIHDFQSKFPIYNSLFTTNPNTNTDHYETEKDGIAETYTHSYDEFAGTYAQEVMGFSDEVINDAFEGDPEACWNVD